ncbi:MAG: cytochrome b/b6 domain-containing protein [Deltaproteobacteria bacterium]|nr:cytochrome b/b6 domain-containing protein [Candidatus Deferrimicrobium borealis]
MKEIKVWDLQTRIFHWLLVVFVFCTFVTSDMPRIFGMKTLDRDAWLSFHIGTGVAAGLLLAFRIFWGFFGPYYSKFSSLHLSLKELFGYLDSVRKYLKTSYTGHNPGASWNLICILIIGMLAIASGGMVFGLDERRGVLRFLYITYYPYADAMKLLHLGVSYILLAVIFGHVAGVLMETKRHRTGIILAMFTGKKRSDETERPLSTGMPLTVISFAWVASPVLVAYFFSTMMGTKQPVTLTIPPIYKKECGSCHMAFPPNALPEKSWKIMMAGLQDHFGDDASIEESSRKEIEGFLVKNSAEKSLEEASIKFIRSIGKENPPLRITEIRYWKEKHKSVPQAVYRRETIKSKSNCVACHKWSEYGSFEDSDIKIPRK